MIDIHMWPTPNSLKVTILLEEIKLLDPNFEYRVVPCSIGTGDQFKDDFIKISPNNRMPALVDNNPIGGGEPISVFESGAMMLYIAEKTGYFWPQEAAAKYDVVQWVMWQMGSAPYLGGGFGHFYSYAPEKFEYPIDRFAMEVKRQLDVLDRQLADHEFVSGESYTIADMAIWPWYGSLVKNTVYEAAEFLEAHTYTNILRWTDELAKRPAVQRGRMVNRAWGELSSQLHERHDASDFDLRTQDKLDGEK